MQRKLKLNNDDDAHEVEELERQPLVGAKTGTATDLTDVGLWPVKVDREICAMLDRQGSVLCSISIMNLRK